MSLDPIRIDIDGSTAGFDGAADGADARMGALQSATDQLAQSLAGLGDGLNRAGKALMPVSAGITAAAGAGFALAMSASAAGDRIAKGARAAGVGSGYYQELAFALAQVAGISEERTGAALEVLTRRIGEAAAGSDSATEALERLGFSQQEIADGAVTTEAAFDALLDVLANAESPAAAAATAADVLGRSYAEMGGLLHGAGDEVDQLRSRFHELGLELSEDQLGAAEAFGDKMDELQRQMGAVRSRIGTALIPLFIRLADTLQDKVVPGVEAMVGHIERAIDWFNGLPGPVQEAAGLIAGALGVGGPVLLALGAVSSAMAALVAATGPIGLFIAAAALLTVAWMKWGDDIMAAIGGALDWVTEQFEAFLEFVRGIPAQLAQIGRDMIQGLIDGFLEKWEELKALVYELATMLPAWMRDLLGIQSPSRVFHEIGTQIGEGLALGIAESQGMVADAVRTMGGGAVAAAGDTVAGVLDAMGALFSGSKKIGAGIALINTLIGASEALKLPFPQNLAAFAQTASTGMGAVRGIRGATPGGGGAGSVGGSRGGAPAAVPTQTMFLNFTNDPFGHSERTARYLAEQVNAAQRNGARVLFQVPGA